MSNHLKKKYFRKLRKNWLFILSVILIVLSGFFYIQIEKRANPASTTNTDTNRTQ